MPRKPIDYSNVSIYKIEHIENENLLYVGHTTEFNKRKSAHKGNCKNENGKEFNKKLYEMIRQNGGWDMFKMIEIEKYSCNDKREAEKRENEVMKELKASMNTYRSFTTEEEKSEQLRKLTKENYEKNRDIFKENQKEYYKKNKAIIQEKSREYYNNNKQEINIKKIEYRKKNREKTNEKTLCDCGCEVAKQHLKRHQETKKHNDLMNKINS